MRKSIVAPTLNIVPGQKGPLVLIGKVPRNRFSKIAISSNMSMWSPNNIIRECNRSSLSNNLPLLAVSITGDMVSSAPRMDNNDTTYQTLIQSHLDKMTIKKIKTLGRR